MSILLLHLCLFFFSCILNLYRFALYYKEIFCLYFFLAILTEMCDNMYVTKTLYPLLFPPMENFDSLSTSRESVINLTDVPTSIAIAQAKTCKRISIAIDHIEHPGVMVLPIRIIEGMEDLTKRGRVTYRQASLISSLVSLLQESPLCRA